MISLTMIVSEQPKYFPKGIFLHNRCLEVILLSKEFAIIYYRTDQSKNEIPGKQRVINE